MKIMSTNLQVLMIIPRPAPLWVIHGATDRGTLR